MHAHFYSFKNSTKENKHSRSFHFCEFKISTHCLEFLAQFSRKLQWPRALHGKGESRGYGTVEKQNTSLCVCISIHVLYLYFSLSHCFVSMSVCAEEGKDEKMNKEHRPLILCLALCLCLPLNMGVVVRKYERGYHCT